MGSEREHLPREPDRPSQTETSTGARRRVVPGRASGSSATPGLLDGLTTGIVQQIQRRVVGGMQLPGGRVNDDDRLEREADVMGAGASRIRLGTSGLDPLVRRPAIPNSRVHPFTIQRVLAKTQFDPDPKKKSHKNEKLLETDTLNFADKLALLTHGRNKGYTKSAEYVAVVDEVLHAPAEKWRAFIADSPALFRTFCTTYRKKGKGYASDVQAIAKDFLEHYTPQGDPTPFFVAKMMLPAEVAEQFDLEKALATLREKQAEEEAGRKRELRTLALQFLQIAHLFAKQIPTATKALDASRAEFVSLLDELCETIEIALEKGSSELADAAVRSVIDEVKTKARLIVSFVNNFTPERRVPTTFEETLPAPMLSSIEEVRAQVEEILAPALLDIQKRIPGASLKYRGSLTDAIKNYNKSEKVPAKEERAATLIDFDKRAVPVNVKAFDVDAFIEVPDATWKEWESHHLIPSVAKAAIKGKILIDQWIPLLERQHEEGNAHAKVAIDQALALKQIESELQRAMVHVRGYKLAEASSSQPKAESQSKSTKEIEYGKPYPLGELSRGGSAYEELTATWKVLREQGLNVQAAWLSEEHTDVGHGAPRRVQARQRKERSEAYDKLEQIDLGDVALSRPQLATIVGAIAQGSLPKLKRLVLPSSTRADPLLGDVPERVQLVFTVV